MGEALKANEEKRVATPGPVEGDPHVNSVEAPALRGSIWTLGGYAAGQLIRLASNLILTRMLFPALFGQMALVQIFLQGLAMFSDVGTGPAIIQSPRGDDPKFLNTAWTVQCMRGAALWAATWALAWPVAAFYEQPLLRWLIPATGFCALVAGFESTAVHGMQRHLKLGRLTMVEFTSQTAGVVAMNLLVLAARSVFGPNDERAIWALVAGNILASGVRLALSHLALPGVRHRFLLDAESFRQQLGFGRWVFFNTMLTFLAGQLDRLIFGKLIPIDLLGVYGIAAMLAALPVQGVLKLGTSVVFPTFSRVVGRPDFERLFWRVRLPFLLGGAVLVTGLFASGPFLIEVLYDPRYQAAGWILQYLAVLAWFQVLEATNAAALLAMAHVRWLVSGSVAKVIGMAALVPLGYHLAGFPGALVGVVVSEVAKYLVSALAASRRGIPGFAPDLAISAAIAASAGLAFWVGQRTASGARDHGSLLGFLAAGSLAVAPWAAAALWSRRSYPDWLRGST